jgi:hypothetical protein
MSIACILLFVTSTATIARLPGINLEITARRLGDIPTGGTRRHDAGDDLDILPVTLWLRQPAAAFIHPAQ